MKSSDEKKNIWILFEEVDGKHESIVGKVVDETSSFIKIQTNENIVSIPIARVIKIKEKLGGLDDRFR